MTWLRNSLNALNSRLSGLLSRNKARQMWLEKDNRLVREFRFKDFQEAFTFMTRVAFLAEKHAHHPSFHNEYSYVRIELHTHDAGRVVTDKDRHLAEAIDQLLQ